MNLTSLSPMRGVEHLSLSYFRCYEDFQVSLTPQPVVLTGPNGAGKTNMLEAISFLIPGRGLRRAKLSDVRQQQTTHPWTIRTLLKNEAHQIRIGTGLDPESPERERRITKINGEKAKSQTALSEWVSVVWLTPQMDRLFLEGSQGRRRFLDRIVYGFDSGHAQRLNRYERALRERNILLRQGHFDRSWMDGLEETLVNEGVAIVSARREVVGQLSKVLQNQDTTFPQAEVSLVGPIEKLLEENSLLESEEKLRGLLRESREQDRLVGQTSLGPHRSDLAVRHTAKNQAAALCSTGEQKALLISLILSAATLLSVRTEAIPLLLLDEITAHLDEERRTSLFDALLRLKMQAWLTGTDASLFQELQGNAQFLSLENGKILSQT